MIDRLEAMCILSLTVNEGSFSAASRALRMPLPTVSRKVSELEAHLGTRLLVRTTRKLALTDAASPFWHLPEVSSMRWTRPNGSPPGSSGLLGAFSF